MGNRIELQKMGTFRVVNRSTQQAYRILLSIDLNGLAGHLASGAIKNKSRKSRLASGLIVAEDVTDQVVNP